jgi:hypothetical protein
MTTAFLNSNTGQMALKEGRGKNEFVAANHERNANILFLPRQTETGSACSRLDADPVLR